MADFDEGNWPKNVKVAKVFNDFKHPILGHDISADGNLLLVYSSREILLYDVIEATLKKRIDFSGDDRKLA